MALTKYKENDILIWLFKQQNKGIVKPEKLNKFIQKTFAYSSYNAACNVVTKLVDRELIIRDKRIQVYVNPKIVKQMNLTI